MAIRAIMGWLHRIHDAVGQCGVAGETDGLGTARQSPFAGCQNQSWSESGRPPKLVGCDCRLVPGSGAKKLVALGLVGGRNEPARQMLSS